MNDQKTNRFVIVGLLALLAFFGSYSFAISKTRGGANVNTAFNGAGGTQVANGAAGGAGGGCCGGSGGGCGGGGSQTPIEADTTVEGDVQKIKVDASTGSFDPNTINAKAGVPIEIEFSQAPGGCLSAVLFADFGIQEDLTGGGKTIKLPALEAGEYAFSCQMQMVSGKIVVK